MVNFEAEGSAAYRAGLSIELNPYSDPSDRWAWSSGWLEARRLGIKHWRAERVERAVRAIASFPLPINGMTAQENYRRVLSWLYDGGRESVASLVIDLTMADMERERAERRAPQDPPGASVADAVSCEGSEAGRRVAGCGGREDGDG